MQYLDSWINPFRGSPTEPGVYLIAQVSKAPVVIEKIEIEEISGDLYITKINDKTKCRINIKEFNDRWYVLIKVVFVSQRMVGV